ncbi:hypothetical protein [Aliikangiella coralliicola]|uniref:Uncharacterized protein n=1 Tax=Aliikangiella coralliicola TaxID=2592383 RepID=A0A545U904_9GAMM|nr:hypothetical protein [Aliikangiella coralliicola]TQV85960.1 hypothetical protein FLL46_18765 [Aliikangiella coralliicola]
MTRLSQISSRFLPVAEPISPQQLELAVDFAQALVMENSPSLAQTMQALSDIALPDLRGDISGQARDYSALKTLAPLYLAFELEQAGLLTTAERISGLFFSGAIDQSLGDAEKAINQFWQNRHKRLNQSERETLLQQTFEARFFYPQFSKLCEAVTALADNEQQRDFQEEVSLDIILQSLREYFYSRSLGMITFASEDILNSISLALTFLKARALLTAFGVHSLWGLLAVSADKQEYKVRQHAEMASAGMYIINWMATPNAGQIQFSNPQVSSRLFSAAHRWLLAFATLESSPGQSLFASDNSNGNSSSTHNSANQNLPAWMT